MGLIRTLWSKIFQKETAPAIFLVLNTFVWYLLTYVIFSGIINALKVEESQRLGLFAAYFIGIAVTAIIGSKVSSLKRNSLLSKWLFLGVIATFILPIITGSNLITDVLIACFFGISIGLGLPSCLSYFAKSTSIEKRGLIGGVIWSAVGFIVLAFAFLISMVGLLEATIILAIWRLIGGIGFVFLNRMNNKNEAQKSPTYLTLIRKKEVMLYFLPWVMFTLVNFVEVPIVQKPFSEQLIIFSQLAEFALIGIFAFIGGFVADIAGRKRVVIAGFVMLGIEYAIMSMFSGSELALYVFTLLDGISWGLLFSVFFTVIWGDLGEHFEKEKFYALGGIPFLLANFLSILIEPHIPDNGLPILFTIASFFLFVAVIPLMYAPETLPEKAIKDRDLKSYIEKAQKEALKGEKQNQKKKETTEQEPEDEKEENTEYDETLKLAEKYY